MGPDYERRSVLQALKSNEKQVTLRIVASISIGLILAGGATFNGWLFGSALRLLGSLDFWMIVSLFVGSLIWLALLWVIWRPVRRAGAIVWPILGTITVGVITLLGVALADLMVRSNDELVMSAVGLAGGGVALLIWLPAILRLLHGNPVIGADKQVVVHCPSCGYSLIGLNELRCPECGETFTIDELIRAQGYGGAEMKDSSIRIAQNAPNEDTRRRTMHE